MSEGERVSAQDETGIIEGGHRPLVHAGGCRRLGGPWGGLLVAIVPILRKAVLHVIQVARPHQESPVTES